MGEPVPVDVYDAAARCYVRPAGDPDRAAAEPVVRRYAGARWPDAPADIEQAAFWVLSAACGSGVAQPTTR